MGTKTAATPRAKIARYDAATRRVVIALANGVDVAIPISRLAQIASADAAALARVEVIGAGNILHWESLDADYSVPALVVEAIGHGTARRELARAAGRVSTDAKSAAARANGKKGGRPKKARPSRAR